MRENALFCIGLLASLSLHAGVATWLLSPKPVPRMESGAPEMMVSMIAAAPMPQQSAAPTAVAATPPEPLAEISKPVVKKQVVIKPSVSTAQQQTAESTTSVASAAPVAAPRGEQALPMVAASHEANYLHNPKPAYPSFSRRLGEQGRVVLRVNVSAEGVPLVVELKQSSGFARLDDAALETARRWRFVPARRGDEAMVSWVEIPVQFSLDKK